jgi:hypothetical protein
MDQAGITCPKHTVTRWLKKQGVKHHLSLRRPFLGPQAVAARWAFAARYRNKAAEFWYTWFFGDEVSIDRRHPVYSYIGPVRKREREQTSLLQV